MVPSVTPRPGRHRHHDRRSAPGPIAGARDGGRTAAPRPGAAGPRHRRSRWSRSWPGRPCSCPATRWAARPPREPGTPAAEGEAFQPFWDTYHTISDRYAGGEVDRTTRRPGRHPRHDRRARRPVLGVPDLGRVPPEPAGDQRPVRGHRRRDRDAGARRHARAAPRSARDCRLVVTKPIDGLAGRQGGRQGRRRRDLGRRRLPLDGLTVDAARDRIRGPKGSVVTLDPPARHGAPIQLTITRDVVQSTEVESKVLADGTVGYIGLDGLLGRGGRRRRGRPQGTPRRRPDEAHPRPARQPGRLRHGRAQDRQPVHRRRASVFWEQDAQGDQVATDALGDGVATGADHPASSCSSTAAARRPARSSRARSRTRGRAHARRPAVVRQGHRPAVAGAERRGRRVQADDRALADPGQALDPRHRPDAGCRRDRCRRRSRPAATRRSTRRSRCWPARRLRPRRGLAA